jgi:hypothetical protein
VKHSKLAGLTVLVAATVLGLGIGSASADEYDDWCQQDDNWLICYGDAHVPAYRCSYIPYHEIQPGGPHLRCYWEYLD